MCFSAPKAPPPPKYKTLDGTEFEDPNAVSDYNRKLNLAAAIGGYDWNKTYEDMSAPVADPAAPAAPAAPPPIYQGGNVGPGGRKMPTLGFQPGAPGAEAAIKKPDSKSNYDKFLSTLDEDQRKKLDEYYNQGLTAADYRADAALQKQKEEAEQAEKDRQAGIAANRGAVDTALGQFDDAYFRNISDTVLNYYMPQLNQQFDKAGKKLTYSLARRGVLKSTNAGDQRGDLQTDYGIQRAGIIKKAQDAADAAKAAAAQTKAGLYGLAETAADPVAVNEQIGAETSRIKAMAPELTPMAHVFSDYATPALSMIGTGVQAGMSGYQGLSGLVPSAFKNNKAVNQGKGY